MKILHAAALIALAGCTSHRNETALGVLVGVEEYRPGGVLKPCDVVTTLTLQTAQSGRTEVTLGNVEAARFDAYKGKPVEVRVDRRHTLGCATTTVTITESAAAR